MADERLKASINPEAEFSTVGDLVDQFPHLPREAVSGIIHEVMLNSGLLPQGRSFVLVPSLVSAVRERVSGLEQQLKPANIGASPEPSTESQAGYIEVQPVSPNSLSELPGSGESASRDSFSFSAAPDAPGQELERGRETELKLAESGTSGIMENDKRNEGIQEEPSSAEESQQVEPGERSVSVIDMLMAAGYIPGAPEFMLAAVQVSDLLASEFDIVDAELESSIPWFIGEDVLTRMGKTPDEAAEIIGNISGPEPEAAEADKSETEEEPTEQPESPLKETETLNRKSEDESVGIDEDDAQDLEERRWESAGYQVKTEDGSLDDEDDHEEAEAFAQRVGEGIDDSSRTRARVIPLEHELPAERFAAAAKGAAGKKPKESEKIAAAEAFAARIAKFIVDNPIEEDSPRQWYTIDDLLSATGNKRSLKPVLRAKRIIERIGQTVKDKEGKIIEHRIPPAMFRAIALEFGEQKKEE